MCVKFDGQPLTQTGDRLVKEGGLPARKKLVQMSPSQFRKWRKSLGLKQGEAAELLGLKKRMIQYYENGKREGKKVKIPKYVRLACFAVQDGISDFDGE